MATIDPEWTGGRYVPDPHCRTHPLGCPGYTGDAQWEPSTARVTYDGLLDRLFMESMARKSASEADAQTSPGEPDIEPHS